MLHRALTVDSPFYDASARVGDVCRAVGVPLALLAGSSTEDVMASGPVSADVGFVLLRLDPATAAAESPLTRQSAWIVPMGRGWCLQVWDGQPPRHPLPAAAMSLSQGHRDGFALAVWWARPPAEAAAPADIATAGSARLAPRSESAMAPPVVRAGFLFARSGRAVAAHEWSTRVDLGVGHTAATAGSSRPRSGNRTAALDITAVLRRRVSVPEPTSERVPARVADKGDPMGALLDLLTLLRVPEGPVGLDQEDLVEMARSAPGARARAAPVAAARRAAGPGGAGDRASTGPRGSGPRGTGS